MYHLPLLRLGLNDRDISVVKYSKRHEGKRTPMPRSVTFLPFPLRRFRYRFVSQVYTYICAHSCVVSISTRKAMCLFVCAFRIMLTVGKYFRVFACVILSVYLSIHLLSLLFFWKSQTCYHPRTMKTNKQKPTWIKSDQNMLTKNEITLIGLSRQLTFFLFFSSRIKKKKCPPDLTLDSYGFLQKLRQTQRTILIKEEPYGQIKDKITPVSLSRPQ